MYEEGFALNNQKWLICHKTQPNQLIYIYIYIVLFCPVKPELGVIPSGQKTFNSEHLNFPGKENSNLKALYQENLNVHC